MTTPPKEERRRRLIDALKSARNVFLFAFVGLFATTALGYVREVSQWASSSGAKPLPGLNTLGYAVVSALTAAAPAALALVWRGTQAFLGIGDQPVYPSTPGPPPPN